MQADRQEVLVKAEQRRMAIERANKMLYDDTDDVRALHGKLMLSEASLDARSAAASSCWNTKFGLQNLQLCMMRLYSTSGLMRRTLHA
jgi:hypothetical protein